MPPASASEFLGTAFASTTIAHLPVGGFRGCHRSKLLIAHRQPQPACALAGRVELKLLPQAALNVEAQVAFF